MGHRTVAAALQAWLDEHGYQQFVHKIPEGSAKPTAETLQSLCCHQLPSIWEFLYQRVKSPSEAKYIRTKLNQIIDSSEPEIQHTVHTRCKRLLTEHRDRNSRLQRLLARRADLQHAVGEIRKQLRESNDRIEALNPDAVSAEKQINSTKAETVSKARAAMAYKTLIRREGYSLQMVHEYLDVFAPASQLLSASEHLTFKSLTELRSLINSYNQTRTYDAAQEVKRFYQNLVRTGPSQQLANATIAMIKEMMNDHYKKLPTVVPLRKSDAIRDLDRTYQTLRKRHAERLKLLSVRYQSVLKKKMLADRARQTLESQPATDELETLRSRALVVLADLVAHTSTLDMLKTISAKLVRESTLSQDEYTHQEEDSALKQTLELETMQLNGLIESFLHSAGQIMNLARECSAIFGENSCLMEVLQDLGNTLDGHTLMQRAALQEASSVSQVQQPSQTDHQKCVAPEDDGMPDKFGKEIDNVLTSVQYSNNRAECSSVISLVQELDYRKATVERFYQLKEAALGRLVGLLDQNESLCARISLALEQRTELAIDGLQHLVELQDRFFNQEMY
ncbi:hypothetical protein BJ742DRAFT_799816 [Cladochytrium replicatum]|nr:hypothetical protein BJ742DRAFT_799816 [Cladochytrium replicatum]